jgi:hypothetical protein
MSTYRASGIYEGSPNNNTILKPGQRYTYTQYEAQDLNPDGFMWPKEECLVHWIMRENEMAFAWDASQRSTSTPSGFPQLHMSPGSCKTFLSHQAFERR